MITLRLSTAVATLTAALALASMLPARAALPALGDFAAVWAKVDDYTCKIVVHETQGSAVQDRTYAYAFKKPHLARILVESGPGRGSGATWRGGDTVSGHQGGILSGIHLRVSIHDHRATSLRGDTMNTASFQFLLDYYTANEANESESPGPMVDGAPTEQITLADPDPSKTGGVTRELLLISSKTHLPVVRQRFEGATLVKNEHFIDVSLNPGLKDSGF